MLSQESRGKEEWPVIDVEDGTAHVVRGHNDRITRDSVSSVIRFNDSW